MLLLELLLVASGNSDVYVRLRVFFSFSSIMLINVWKLHFWIDFDSALLVSEQQKSCCSSLHLSVVLLKEKHRSSAVATKMPLPDCIVTVTQTTHR